MLPPDRTSKVANLFPSKVQIAEYANCNFTLHDQLQQPQIKYYFVVKNDRRNSGIRSNKKREREERDKGKEIEIIEVDIIIER